jgi:predicted kinase
VDLVVLAGLQGSGKSTFYRARFASTHAHVSKDLFPSAPDPRRRQRELVLAAAREGRSAVVDDTNVRRADREPLVALAREAGMRAVCYWFPPDVAGSLARNARREGRARVPDVAIHATRARLEPPSAAEGWDELWLVQADEGGAFLLRRADGAPAGGGAAPEP